jgi:hypothetical protein
MARNHRPHTAPHTASRCHMTDPFFLVVVFFFSAFPPLRRRHDTLQSFPHSAFTDELQGCWYALSATLTTVNTDESLADISLAAFGRKEIQIAEVCLSGGYSSFPRCLYPSDRMRCLASCICERKLVSYNSHWDYQLTIPPTIAWTVTTAQGSADCRLPSYVSPMWYIT